MVEMAGLDEWSVGSAVHVSLVVSFHGGRWCDGLGQGLGQTEKTPTMG